jgi:TonB family protein
MMAAWMAYSLFVSLFVACAARAAESGLRIYGRPLRALWAGALGVSLALPAAAYLLPSSRPLSSAPLGLGPALDGALELAPNVIAPVSAVVPPESLLARLDAVLALLWVIASLALLSFHIGSYVRLRRVSRRWSAGAIAGRKVLLSETLGPAVIGSFRGRILLPRWALELEDELRRIILVHEEEHLRAGDHRLLHGALVALLLAPWNLPLWWQFRRLRLAVELDCDQRVLRRGVRPGVYGRLLLEIGRRHSRTGFLPAAFSEPRPLLEERVRNITPSVPGRRRGRAIAAAGLGGLSLALACAAPSPERGAGIEPAGERAKLTGVVADARTGAPLASAAIVLEGADRGALSAENGRYYIVNAEPGVYDVTVALPGYETFRAEDVELEAGETRLLDIALTPSVPAPPLSERPVFTPYTTRPRIKDRRQAVEIVERHYPEHLRQSGIGGTTNVWVLIGEDGRVKNTQVQKSSGNPELDEAAQAAAWQFEFIPARDKDKAAAVWVAIPIAFSVDRGPGPSPEPPAGDG